MTNQKATIGSPRLRSWEDVTNRITALLRLTRAEHSVMLVVAVIAAEAVAKSIPVLPILLLSLTTPIFISAASFAINDYYDVRSDRLNKRSDRPIVSGAISRRTALYVFLVSFLIGVLASALINYTTFTIAIVFGILAFLYSYRMKDMLLLGNAYIAFSMAIPFIYGNYVVSGVLSPNIVIISLVIFFGGLAREIHGMIRDYSGDMKARRTRNLVFYTGKRPAAWIAFFLYLAAIALSLFMFFYLKPFAHNLVYLVPIIAVDAALLYVALGYLVRKPSASFIRASRNISLGAMALALLVYLASALVYVA